MIANMGFGGHLYHIAAESMFANIVSFSIFVTNIITGTDRISHLIQWFDSLKYGIEQVFI